MAIWAPKYDAEKAPFDASHSWLLGDRRPPAWLLAFSAAALLTARRLAGCLPLAIFGCVRGAGMLRSWSTRVTVKARWSPVGGARHPPSLALPLAAMDLLDECARESREQVVDLDALEMRVPESSPVPQPVADRAVDSDVREPDQADLNRPVGFGNDTDRRESSRERGRVGSVVERCPNTWPGEVTEQRQVGRKSER